MLQAGYLKLKKKEMMAVPILKQIWKLKLKMQLEFELVSENSAKTLSCVSKISP